MRKDTFILTIIYENLLKQVFKYYNNFNMQE